MKFIISYPDINHSKVTPFMGVWIEIMNVWSTNVAHKRLQRGSHILSDRMSSSQMGYIIGTTKKCKEVHRKAGEMRTLRTAAIIKKVNQIHAGYFNYYGIIDNSVMNKKYQESM